MSTKSEECLTLEQLKQLQRQPDRIGSQVVELLETLTSPDEELRAWATDCLQELPYLDEAQAADVAKFCLHENPAVASRACLLLSKAPNGEVLQARLAEVLDSGSCDDVKQSAAATLGNLPRATGKTLDSLKRASQSSDPRLQRLAKAALEKFDC